MDWLSEKIDNALQWIKQLVINILETLWDLLTDFILFILDALLSAIVAIIALIPMPDFMTDGLQTSVNSFPQLLLYIMSNTGITSALGILAAGFGFRMIRKAATLFQW